MVTALVRYRRMNFGKGDDKQLNAQFHINNLRDLFRTIPVNAISRKIN